MTEIGRIVVKIAGRDAGKKGIIIHRIDDNFVTIDGQVRRKKCNIKHLEFLKEQVKIDDNAEHGVVVSELKKLGIEVVETKKKEKKDKPVKIRGKKPVKAPDKKQKKDKKDKKAIKVKEPDEKKKPTA